MQHPTTFDILLWILEGNLCVSLSKHKAHVKMLIKELNKLAKKENNEL
jgi:hypothetical protein